MLLTDRQTDRQTDRETDNDENITFAMAEVIMFPFAKIGCHEKDIVELIRYNKTLPMSDHIPLLIVQLVMGGLYR